MPGLMISEVPWPLIYAVLFCFVLFCLSYLGSSEAQLILVHHRKSLGVKGLQRLGSGNRDQKSSKTKFQRQKIVVVKSTTLTIYYLSDLRKAI